MSEYHISVLLHETIDSLQVTSGKTYIDATLGGGGHTEAILQRGGVVLGIDSDDEALQYVRDRFTNLGITKNATLVRGNFGDIASIAREQGIEKVDGILFDLGVSSHQFNTATRGFSFQYDGPLDMRMNTRDLVSAKDLVNGLHRGELVALFKKFGEERHAKTIAAAIVEARQVKPIETTRELAAIVEQTVGKNPGKNHPATLIFQALRIAVNDELHVLQEGLKQSSTLLNQGGRLAVISFHSLEDRLVKHAFDTDKSLQAVNKKPIVPTEEEVKQNRRARSAKLRIFEKIV